MRAVGALHVPAALDQKTDSMADDHDLGRAPGRWPAEGDQRPAEGDERPAEGDQRPAEGDERPADGYDRDGLSWQTRVWLREAAQADDAWASPRRPASHPPEPRVRLPLWPVLAALLLLVAIAAVLTVHLARSGANTIFGAGSGDTESSLNWSGYIATHARFRTVTASWIVPAVRTTSDPRAAASFWVGLDGRDGHSLQQIGTTSGMSGAAPYYGAWWEMLPGPSVEVPMTIAAGDSITASVVAGGGGTFLLSLIDTTNGQRFSTRQVDAAAPLSSAEVVAEAPTSAGGLLPLADFGTVRFTGVRANGRPLGTFDWSKVNMVTGARTLASTSALSAAGAGFTVAWDRP